MSNSETSIVKFDSEELTKRISKLMQDKFSELIPHAVWEEMVKTEIEKFKQKLFPELIQEALKEKAIQDIKEFIDSQDIWSIQPGTSGPSQKNLFC